MKKTNHIQAAVNSLKKAREQYQTDHDKFEVAENSARRSKEMMSTEIAKLNKQIAAYDEPSKYNSLVAASLEPSTQDQQSGDVS